MKRILIPILSLFLIGCSDDTLPKPKGFLRLDYPTASYKRVTIDAPFSFDKNILANPISNLKKEGNGEAYSVNIKYPSVKGTLYLNYKKVISGEFISKKIEDKYNLDFLKLTKIQDITKCLVD